MKRHLAPLALGLGLALPAGGRPPEASSAPAPAAAPGTAAPDAGGAVPPSGGDAALVERGRYLVHEVAMCVQCHSPRDGAGNLIPTRLLTGSPVPVGAPYPRMPWASQAPHLAGLPGTSRDDIVRLLTEGIGPRGRRPRPPMPPFRMTAGDAGAVAAYLASLD